MHNEDIDSPSIIFIPFHYRHWEMFLPLVQPLEEAGIDVRFVVINGFNYIPHHPPENELKQYNLWQVNLSKNYRPKNKFQFFWIIYRELLPFWKNCLRGIETGAVVSPDYAAIHRFMLRVAKKKGLKTLTLQDGHYVTLPLDFGSNLESKFRRTIKKIALNLPIEKFMNREPGAVSDYFGLYGNKVKERICKEHPRFKNQIISEITGSPRHLNFRDEFLNIPKRTNNNNEFRILCLPTGFAPYHDQRLDDDQDVALKWVLDVSIEMESKVQSSIKIDLKLKNGYSHYFDHYKKLLDHSMVNLIDETASLPELFAKTDIVITTGSTASLEAAICKLPVIQIAPEYLQEKLIFVSGLPIAKSCKEVKELFEQAYTDTQQFYQKYCFNVREELADIDPEWNSVNKTSEWLRDLVNV